jgi:hypothetical protein
LVFVSRWETKWNGEMTPAPQPQLEVILPLLSPAKSCLTVATE